MLCTTDLVLVCSIPFLLPQHVNLDFMRLQYVSWSSTARGSLLHMLSHGVLGDPGTPDAFYTDATCRQHFRWAIPKSWSASVI